MSNLCTRKTCGLNQYYWKGFLRFCIFFSIVKLHLKGMSLSYVQRRLEYGGDTLPSSMSNPENYASLNSQSLGIFLVRNGISLLSTSKVSISLLEPTRVIKNRARLCASKWLDSISFLYQILSWHLSFLFNQRDLSNILI